MTTKDLVEFVDDLPFTPATEWKQPWRVLVVDDDTDVHRVTEMVLRPVSIEGRKIQITSVFSGKEALTHIRSHLSELPDLVLMDVVMDTPTDGIDTAHTIRDELALLEIPVIIIRTGQPGHLAMDELMHDTGIDLVLIKSALVGEDLKRYVTLGLQKGRAGLRNIVTH